MPLDSFCASAKHNSSPNTYSIDSASLISSGTSCGGAGVTLPVETPETTPDKILRCNPGADIIQAIQAIDIGVSVSITGSAANKYSRSGKLYAFEDLHSQADFKMYAPKVFGVGSSALSTITREMVLAKQAELNAICSADPTTLKHEKFCEEGESPRLINNSTFSCQR